MTRHEPHSTEYYRAGAWNALRDARMLYNINKSRGVAVAMKRFRCCLQLSRMNPRTKSLLERREELEVEFVARQKTWNPWAQ